MQTRSPAAVDPESASAHPGLRDPDDDRIDFERLLMEADRMMMQMVSLSLSLIGFGFTIDAFFNNPSRAGGGPADVTVRRLGVALLILGLVFLSSGTWSQAKYRRQLLKRYAALYDPSLRRATLDGRATPTFITAFLLLMIGIMALASIVLRNIL